MRFTVFTSIAVFLACAFPAMAAGPYNPKIEVLAEMNRVPPLQNPGWSKADEILGRKVIDRKNKVVGTVNDVVLNENGNIAALNVSFDRLRLGAPVYIGYGVLNIKPVTNGYAMTFDDDKIAEIYPSLLAGTETAAGGEDTVSLKSLRGMEVWSQDGRRIGLADDILFGGNGNRADALYVTMQSGTLRGAMAIPFGQAHMEEIGQTRRMGIADDLADAMIALAKEK